MADWLHREAVFILDRWANDEFSKPFAELEAEHQGRLSARLGPRRMLGLGVIFASIGIALFWLLIDIMHPLALFVPMAFITLSNGVTLLSATVGAMNVQPMLAGTASGINGAAQMAVSAVILSVIGHFVEFGSHVMVLALTVSFVLACLSYLLVRSSVGPVPAKE